MITTRYTMRQTSYTNQQRRGEEFKGDGLLFMLVEELFHSLCARVCVCARLCASAMHKKKNVLRRPMDGHKVWRTLPTPPPSGLDNTCVTILLLLYQSVITIKHMPNIVQVPLVPPKELLCLRMYCGIWH